MRTLRFLSAAAIAVAAGLFVQGRSLAEDKPPVGGQAKEFPAVDVLNMRPTKNPFKALRGRVVLFMLFATWYERCADAVADCNGLQDRYGPKGLTVIACSEQERKLVEPWIAEKGVKFPWALIDTPTSEQFKKDWPAPGQPWAYLIDVNGKIVWQENPRNIQNPNVMPRGTIEGLCTASTAAPILPKSLADQQKLLDDGTWALAMKSLKDAAAGGKLDKTDAAWATGTAEWLQMRHGKWMADVDALCKKGWWWDAWEMCDDFPRRWEGMDGADAAKAKAEEIRKTPDAAKDLKTGDDTWGKQSDSPSVRDLVAKKNWIPARLKLKRLLGETKGTRWAERVADLNELVPPK
jgi:hypothetical protein